jgi:capsular exopolysaccharide synthesis family protein
MQKTYALTREAALLREFDTNFVELDHAPVIKLVAHPHNLVAFTDQASPGAEKFRVLALRLRNFQKRQHLKKLLVTSSIKGEGKSVISANLAVTLAQQGQRVLILDSDLHQSGLRDVLGSHQQPGLAEWWKDSEPILTFLRRVEGLSLWYLAAGRTSESPMEILQSQRFAEVLEQVASWFDFVIIDSPPLVPVADSTFLAGLADGSLLVVRQARTPKPLLKEALKTENLKPLGIVANEWGDAEHRYYGEYYKSYSSPKVAGDRILPTAIAKSK